MTPLIFDTLLGFLKVAGDETRLKMMCLLSQRAYSAGDLAAALELTPPTVSHHLARLREIGIVNLTITGNTHTYRLNTPLLERIKVTLFTPEMMSEMADHILAANSTELFRQRAEAARAQAEAWLDELDVSDTDRKVLRDYTRDGRIKQIPSKEKKLLVVLRWLATKFAPGVKYTEQEVNAILGAVHPDYASLRRYLIVHGLLAREGGGGRYWRAEDDA